MTTTFTSLHQLREQWPGLSIGRHTAPILANRGQCRQPCDRAPGVTRRSLAPLGAGRIDSRAAGIRPRIARQQSRAWPVERRGSSLSVLATIRYKGARERKYRPRGWAYVRFWYAVAASRRATPTAPSSRNRRVARPRKVCSHRFTARATRPATVKAAAKSSASYTHPGRCISEPAGPADAVKPGRWRLGSPSIGSREVDQENADVYCHKKEWEEKDGRMVSRTVAGE